MPLNPGTRVGAVEIVSLLGAGGMGEVYRGRDTKLGRHVAIKSLPDMFARDPERRARFEREAHLLASLNHAGIAAIYDLREHEHATFLVLELVEGQTLAERIDASPSGMAIQDALDIARQIAEALEAAHARGVVHRDLKPANIKITPDGVVKLLDFGLGKIYEPALASSDSSQSPTLSAMQSAQGVIMGTAPYMSPEQARGKPVDKRADIWSFGCVLYEMLVGRRTFPAGETTSDTLAAVLTRDPDWTALPADTPARIRLLLEHCLRKDYRKRLRDIGDAHITLLDVANAPAEARAAAPGGPRPRRGEYALAGLALVFMLATGVLLTRQQSTPPPVDPIAFEVLPTEGTFLLPGVAIFSSAAPYPALSRAGGALAYVTSADTKQQVWVRPLGSSAARPLPGTEEAFYPFWSPRGDTIAFFSQRTLKKVGVTGGLVQVLSAQEVGPRGGSWNDSDVILIGQQPGPLLRITAAGGSFSPASVLDESLKETAHLFPQFLPDGRHFTYVAARSGVSETDADLGVAEGLATYIGSLDSMARRPLPGIDSPVSYSPTGHLLFVRDNALWAQPFDAARREITGAAVQVAERIGVHPRIGPFSVSATGTLAYQRQRSRQSQLVWFDRGGRELGVAGKEAEYRNLDLSPDDHLVTFSAGQPPDVWVMDLRTSVVSRFTTEPGPDSFPIWSRDGTAVVYRADRQDGTAVLRRSFGVISKDERLVTGEAYPSGWSRDQLIFGRPLINGFDVFALPNASGAEPIPLTNTAFSEAYAAPSPNGLVLAYSSNETGRWEVVVQGITGTGTRLQVSNQGGILPKWRADSRELYYIAPDATLMAIEINWIGDSPRVSAPRPLFRTRIVGGGVYTPGMARQYDVASDGRFLVQVSSEAERPSPMTVIVNWRP